MTCKPPPSPSNIHLTQKPPSAHRDTVVHGRVEDEMRDDPDVERNQISVMKLVVKLLNDDAARGAMAAAGVADKLRRFASHPNRDFSEWSLSFRIVAARKILP